MVSLKVICWRVIYSADSAIQRLNNQGMELKGLKTIDGSTSDWLSLTSGPRSLVKYWFSVQMHEVLFSFVYALTSAKFLFFSMYRIVLKVAGPRKNPIKGVQQAPKRKAYSRME